MGIAALVLGIVSVIVGFIPFCGIIALAPAIVGLILGIIDWVKQNKAGNPKGKAIAGTVCSGVAIVIIAVYYILAGVAVNKGAKAIESYDWNEVNFSINSID